MAQTRPLQRGIFIELVTVAWMTIEAGVSITAGIMAGSALLTAFGIDSVIELITGGVLLWRLRIEAKARHFHQVESAERRAHWIVAIALALLCVYVLFTSIYGLAAHVVPENTFPGMAISLLALIGMPFLARAKKHIALEIGSKALAGDAACSIVCAYLAGTVLVGLLLNTLFQWWWAEHIAGLLFLYWLFGETKEAFEEVHK
ncbi:cation transporter [Candidatus Acetothermia bacterium]|nr:cation transporter [Candidatus Acetothermia bacterium]